MELFSIRIRRTFQLVSTTYDIIPATTLALSPETEKLFCMDDYPERFLQWADKFINIII